jgi:protein-ribulosamine 3-kinase
MPRLHAWESGLWPEIAREISAVTGQKFTPHNLVKVSGGCINSAFRIEGDGQRYFIKLNDPGKEHLFEAEAQGLQEISASASIRAPRPVCWGKTANASYLVLEHIELAPCRGTSCERMGRQLALMHRHVSGRYGWRRDNAIGSTPQGNTPDNDWIAFWRERRLAFQLGLASEKGAGSGLQRKGEHLLLALPQFFSGYTPQASLLHGDLWGGNCAADSQGEPVIFDPAVYYGDRETDLAMSELFGGFPPLFHSAYREAYPLDSGYAARKTLYNLYHILNHYNMFGGGYAVQAEGMVERLLSGIK